MCGRYSLDDLDDTFPSRFTIANVNHLDPRYNVAPTQMLPVVVSAGGSNQAELMEWGLIPSWSKDGKGFINARAETVAVKPSFKKAFRSQRCIVPASSFFEWQKTSSGKVPFLIKLKGEPLFGMAGLYATWIRANGLPVKTYAILTTSANSLMKPIHDRMPVILKKADEAAWLSPRITDQAALHPLLKPYAAAWMAAYRVSPLVNNPANDSPELIKPVS